jgi:predicted component of viral defense system (DUF524 family)
VARALGGYAPSQVRQPLPEETFDTPPNRFAKQFLFELADFSTRLGEEAWLHRHLPQLSLIREELAYARHDRLWDDVGALVRLPAENQVLLKRHGYRELADLWRRFHQARLPIWRAAQEAIDARDIATLYEIWCFFALAEQIGTVLDVPTTDQTWQLDLADQYGLGHRSEVRFGQTGYRLTYNESFGRSRNRSYSITLRPDFTLHGPDDLRVVFDAKFRFERMTFYLPDSDEEDEATQTDPQRTAKQTDLYKMHTYRDALSARAAVTLYPGDNDVFYHLNANRSDQISWPALVAGNWAGIGAIAFEPKNDVN